MNIYLTALLCLVGCQTALGSNAGDAYDRIAAGYVNKTWFEVGFQYVDDSNWAFQQTKSHNFSNPIVLAGLPIISGNTYSQGYPSVIRLKQIQTSGGKVSFYMRSFVPNDTFCLSTWYTPVHHAAQQIAWMVIEKGSYSLNGHVYNAVDGNLTRTSDVLSAAQFIQIFFPLGCGGVSTRCAFPGAILTSQIGFHSSLQDFVYNYYLTVRGQAVNRNSVKMVLQPHDSTTISYYVMTTPTNAGILAYEVGHRIVCIEGISFETAQDTNVTSKILNHGLINVYNYPPGVFGMLITMNSLTDNTNLRVPSVSSTDYNIITQEDQCGDEEMIHITPETAAYFVAGDSSASANLTCFIKYTSARDPTPVPTQAPASVAPTRTPTMSPTFFPTRNPTSTPTKTPTSTPTRTPTIVPTSVPTEVPISQPSVSPTSSPTSSPTKTPTYSPTAIPTASPSVMPTRVPTIHVTHSPTLARNETCIDILVYDAFGDGWGDNVYLYIHAKDNLYSDKMNHDSLDGILVNDTAIYHVPCQCGIVSVCSEIGYFYINVTSDNGPLRNPWEILWEYVDENGKIFIGGYGSALITSADEIVWTHDAINYNVTAEGNECDRCPHKRRPPVPGPGQPGRPGPVGEPGNEGPGSANETETDPSGPGGNAGGASGHGGPGGAGSGGPGGAGGPGGVGAGPGKGPGGAPQPPPPAHVEIDLFNTQSSEGWYDHIYTWDETCPALSYAGDTDHFTLPRVLTYPRYYISNDDRTDLIHSGSLCLVDNKEICEEVLPPDGKFVFRVAGYYPDPSVITWDFCGKSGTLYDELQFQMVHGKCVPIAEFSAADYCAGIVSLGVYSGSILISGVHHSLSDFDSSLLEHVLVSGFSVPSTVTITSTKIQGSNLIVGFALRAKMEDLNMQGVYFDMAEAFTETLSSSLAASCSGGYYNTLLSAQLSANMVALNDALQGATEFQLLSFKLERIEYMNADSSVTYAVADQSLLLESDDDSTSRKYHVMYYVVGALGGLVMVAVLMTMRSRKPSVPSSVRHDTSVRFHYQETASEPAPVPEEEDSGYDIIDSKHGLIEQ